MFAMPKIELTDNDMTLIKMGLENFSEEFLTNQGNDLKLKNEIDELLMKLELYDD